MLFIRIWLAALLLFSGSVYAHNARVSPLKGCPSHLSDNPFVTHDGLSPFPYKEIKFEHFLPAFEYKLKQAQIRFDAIIEDPNKPTFENTVEAYEAMREPLADLISLLFMHFSVKNTDRLNTLGSKIYERYQKFLSASNSNAHFQERLKVLIDKKDRLPLTADERDLLERTAKKIFFDDEAAELRKVNKELADARAEYGYNFDQFGSIVVRRKKDLDGLSDATIAAAAALSEKKRLRGWELSLTTHNFLNVIDNAHNRDLRERFWVEFQTLNFGGEFDNQGNVVKIAKLTQRFAQLMGSDNPVAFRMQNSVAQNMDEANEILDRLAQVLRPKAKEELAVLAEFAGHEIEPWDIEYYRLQMLRKKNGSDGNELKSYFVFDNVLKSAFYTAKRLLGVEFKERFDMQTWHPSVRTFEVFNRLNESLGYFYIDPYHRKGKDDHAFSTSLISGGRFAGRDRRPHVLNVLSLAPPVKGMPTLLSPYDVTVVFHEMGHALHALLSRAKYPSAFGTSVARDLVELPSQLFEAYAFLPEVLEISARHYQTGEALSPSRYQHLQSSDRKLNATYWMRQIFLAKLDFAWFTQPVSHQTVDQFEDEIWRRYMPYPRRGAVMSTHFHHIFSGGYSAAYYSYPYSYVLAAMAKEKFLKNGMWDQATAQLFELAILTPGGSEPAPLIWRRFDDKAPDADVLLHQMGLVPKQLDFFD